MNEDFSDIDFSGLTAQVADLKESYSDLSETFGDLVEDAEKRLGNITDSIKTINLSLADTYSRINIINQSVLTVFTSINAGLMNISKSTKSIVRSFEKLKSMSDLSFMNPAGAKSGESDPIARQHKAVNDSPEESVSEANNQVQGSIQSLNAKMKELEASIKTFQTTQEQKTKEMKGFFEKEPERAGAAAKGLMDQVTQGVTGAGGIFGGILSMIILGTQNTQRIAAQRGEMYNAVEAGGGIFKKGVNDATDWLAKFGENAQYKLGITREEIQKLVKQLSNSGFEISDKLINVNKDLEDVHANVVTLTLGIDKHLNVASGSSMQHTLQLVKDYGYSLDEAAAKIEKLSLAAQRSGSDIQGFINGLMAGSASLAQYGIDLEDVGNLFSNIQNKYNEQLGPGKSQMAGKFAMETTNAIVGAMANMPEQGAMVFTERLFPRISNPTERYTKYKTLLLDADKKPELLRQIIPQFINELGEKASHSNNPEYWLMTQDMYGKFTPQQAKLIMDMYKGGFDSKAYKEAGPKQIEELNNAFKLEGETLTMLQKTQRDIINALTKIGEGMLKALGGILGILVGTFRSLPDVLEAIMIKMNPLSTSQQKDNADRIFSNVSAMQDRMLDVTWSGLKDAWSGAGDFYEVLKKAMGELMHALKDAMTTDFKKGTTDEALRAVTASVEGIRQAYIAGDDALAEQFKKLNEKFVETSGGAFWDKPVNDIYKVAIDNLRAQQTVQANLIEKLRDEIIRRDEQSALESAKRSQALNGGVFTATNPNSVKVTIDTTDMQLLRQAEERLTSH